MHTPPIPGSRVVSALEEVEPLSLDGVINGSWHSIPENMKVTFIIHGRGGGGGGVE